MEEICSLPDLKAVLFGPFDTSLAYGFGGVKTDEVQKTLENGVQTALKSNVQPIIPVFGASGEKVKGVGNFWAEMGVKIFICGLDTAFLATTAKLFSLNLK